MEGMIWTAIVLAIIFFGFINPYLKKHEAEKEYEADRRHLENKKNEYEKKFRMAIQRNDKKSALEFGRKYYACRRGLSRNDLRTFLTPYDEQALANDLRSIS